MCGPRSVTVALVALLGVGCISPAVRAVRAHPEQSGSVVGPAQVTVAYHPGYRVTLYGWERLHPFDLAKYDRIATDLLETGLLSWEEFLVPREPTFQELRAVHTATYLHSLRSRAVIRRATESPPLGAFTPRDLDQRMLLPMRLQAHGTYGVAVAALESGGVGINLGGGAHHAHPDKGHGFCVYNDVAMAVGLLRRDGFEGTVLIVDTDAHQGDGNHAAFQGDETVITFSMHAQGLFPPRVAGDRDRELGPFTTDAEFLGILGADLDSLVAEHEPALIIHVAGADVLADDPLGSLSMSIDGLVQRDLLVARKAAASGVPLVHVLAGRVRPERSARPELVGAGAGGRRASRGAGCGVDR